MKKNLISYLSLILGAIIAAFALEKILVPVKILDGGIVGISIIISSLLPISLGILTILLNFPFVLIGGKHLGKEFIIKTFIGMVFFSAFIELFSKLHITITTDELLATIFGGMVLGLGVGLVIRSGGCLDGTETIAIMLSKRAPLSVGQIVLCFNIIIYLCAGALFGLDRALYSLLTYFIVSKVVDMINVGLDQGKALMIITNEGKQISEDIYNNLGRTVTLIEGEGLISGEKTVLYCVITRMELASVRKIIEKDDYSAFMTVTDVSEIIGKHIKSTSKNV